MVSQNLYDTNCRDATEIAKNLIGTNLTCIDLEGAILRRINLSGANLFKARLINTNLREANLSNARLSGADLSGADLRKANLRRANLHKANFSKATLRNANLSEADFREARLSGADLRGANLRQTNFNKAYLFKANLSRGELSGADLSDANLSQANLSNLDLSGAELSGANLSEANLSGTDLSGADLSRATLRYAILSKTDLRCSNLRESNLAGTDLSKADLFGADLREADLSGANLKRTNLRKADIQGAFLKEGIGLSAQEIQDFKERGAIFENPLSFRSRRALLFIHPLDFIEDFEDDKILELHQCTAPKFYLDVAAVQRKQAESAKASSLLSDIFEEDTAASVLPEPDPQAFDENKNSVPGLDALHAEFLRAFAQQSSWSRSALESKAAELNLLLDGALETINDAAFDVCDEPLTDGVDPIELDTHILEQLLS